MNQNKHFQIHIHIMRPTCDKYVKLAISHDRLNHIIDSHGKDMGDKNYYNCSDIMEVDNYDDIQFMRVSDCFNNPYACDEDFRYPKNLKQLVFCPDSFKNEHIDGLLNGNATKRPNFPHFPEQLEELIIYVHYYNITNLPTTLKYLNCEGSRFIKFNCELPPNLIEFNCSDCYIGAHIIYPHYNRFKQLCDNCFVKREDVYGDNTKNMIIIGNDKIPKLPPKLKILKCGYNYIKELPELPSSLIYIDARSTCLEDLPVSLQYCNLSEWDDTKYAFDYYFTEYNIFGKKLRKKLKKKLGQVINPLYNFKYSDAMCSFNWDEYTYYDHKVIKKGKPQKVKLTLLGAMMKRLKQLKSVSIIENWFLECKYNPTYGYCQRRLEKQYNDIYDEGNNDS